MDLKGTIIVINAKHQVSDKFAKREFVIETTEDKYPQKVLFQCTQDRCELLDSVAIGETVTVAFNVRGRDWTNPQGETKYFNSLECWKITNESANDFKPKDGTFTNQGKPVADMLAEDDGLPF
tara:strand:- start:20 stop:388 length:369 start_codon:yes stop_codon:yes gene_type:complete